MIRSRITYRSVCDNKGNTRIGLTRAGHGYGYTCTRAQYV